MCDNVPSLRVAPEISRSNHSMVLTGSKQMVFDLAYIGYFHVRHTRKSIMILLIWKYRQSGGVPASLYHDTLTLSVI